jgi:hypothetical protein
LFSRASLPNAANPNGPDDLSRSSTFNRDVRRDIDARRRLLPRLEQGRRGELLLPERFPWGDTDPPSSIFQIDAKDTKDAVYAKVKEAVNKCLADKGQ